MIKLIINADDFGKSKEINLAIMEAMDLNLCKDTTLLVNFKDYLCMLQNSRYKKTVKIMLEYTLI